MRRRTWRLEAGSTPIDLDRLVSPLRYDVVVREQFLRFVEANLAECDTDFDGFVARCRAQPYYAWYRSVAIHRIQVDEDETAAEQAFAARVRRTVSLYRSFRERGFDPSHPILLRSAGPIATTATGKTLAGRLFPADGCHRLALLRLAGIDKVEPAWYRLLADPRWSPPDNTRTLITVLGLTQPDYLSFIASGYGAGHARFTDETAVLDRITVTDPGSVGEVRALLASDAGLFSR